MRKKIIKKVVMFGCVGSFVLVSIFSEKRFAFAESVTEKSAMDFYVDIAEDMNEYSRLYMSDEITESEYVERVKENIAPKLNSVENEEKLEEGEREFDILKSQIDTMSVYDSANELAEKTFGVTAQEITLFKNHPVKAAKAMTYAKSAKVLSELLWKGLTCWQGNGDAFRHSYWSALMNNNLGKDFAYKESYAHEGYTTGSYSKISNLDVKMDIENNHRGRDLGDVYKSNGYSETEMATGILSNVYNGKLVRIRKGTKSTKYDKAFYSKYDHKTVLMDYFIPTSDGGAKNESVC